MNDKIDLNQIYTPKELKAEFDNLEKKILNSDYLDFSSIYIILQDLKLYFLLTERLGVTNDIFERKKNKLANFKEIAENEYRKYRSKNLLFDSELMHTIDIADIYSKEAFTKCLQKDMKFGYINDVEINLSNYIKYFQSNSKELRREVYSKFYDTIDNYKHVLLNLFIMHLHMQSIRCNNLYQRNVIDQFCISNNLNKNFFLDLFKAYDSGISVVHEYYKFKANKLEGTHLQIEDAMAPIYELPRVHFTIKSAYDIILNALSPLGSEYISCIKEIINEGRIDICDTKNKFKGSYTVCSYNKGPYSSVNFQNNSLNDLFALVHEIGHNVQYKLSLRGNSISNYKIPYIESEVPSMINEFLLYDYLQNNNSLKEREYYIFKELEDYEGGFFRQCRFAKFEYTVKNLPTEEWNYEILTLYKKMLKGYYGKAVVFRDTSSLECLRTPQLYENFYVINYCIGVVIALQIFRSIKKDYTMSDCYLKYLSLGNCKSLEERLDVVKIKFDVSYLFKEAVEYFKYKLQLLNKL